jgi:hypothetical protein
MEAKRTALESIVKKQAEMAVPMGIAGEPGTPTKVPTVLGYRGVGKARRSKKKIGSSGRTRTYNPSVNSRMLYH